MRNTKFGLLGIVLLLAVLAAQGFAVTLTVTKTADTNDGVCNADCSLREAVARANQTSASDAIVFASPLFDSAQTITLTLGSLPIDTTMMINGPGARLLTVASDGSDRVITISSSGDLAISNLAIRNGRSDFGGGIRNDGQCLGQSMLIAENAATSGGGGIYSTGWLEMNGVTVTGNFLNGAVPGAGGGIGIAGVSASTPFARIFNSTISGNIATAQAAQAGGGIAVTQGSALVPVNLYLNNVTIVDNTAGTLGGGVGAVGTVDVRMRNTLMANNVAQDGGPGDADRVAFGNPFVSDGHNLVEDTKAGDGFTNGVNGDIVGSDPAVGPLQDNGGPTDTHAIGIGSPALEAGDNCVVDLNCSGPNIVAFVLDQRGSGFPRRFGTFVDIGAFEYSFTTAAGVAVSGRVASRSRTLSGIVVQLIEADGTVHSTRTNPFGHFSFNDIPSGQSVVIYAYAKGYTFEPQLLNLSEDLAGIVLIPSGK